jgi:hypothetical protein
MRTRRRLPIQNPVGFEFLSNKPFELPATTVYAVHAARADTILVSGLTTSDPLPGHQFGHTQKKPESADCTTPRVAPEEPTANSGVPVKLLMALAVLSA